MYDPEESPMWDNDEPMTPEDRGYSLNEGYFNVIRRSHHPGRGDLSPRQLALFEALDLQLDRMSLTCWYKRFKYYMDFERDMSRLFEFRLDPYARQGPLNPKGHRSLRELRPEFYAWRNAQPIVRKPSLQALGWWHYDECFSE